MLQEGRLVGGNVYENGGRRGGENARTGTQRGYGDIERQNERQTDRDRKSDSQRGGC